MGWWCPAKEYSFAVSAFIPSLRHGLIIALATLCFQVNVYAYRSRDPQTLTDLGDINQIQELNAILKEHQHILNGRYTLENVLEDPQDTRKGTAGDLIYASFGAQEHLCINISSTPDGTDWTCINIGTLSTCPGGIDTQIQFNDNGDCGGDAGFLFEKHHNHLALDGDGTATIDRTDAGVRDLDGNVVSGTASTQTFSVNEEITLDDDDRAYGVLSVISPTPANSSVSDNTGTAIKGVVLLPTIDASHASNDDTYVGVQGDAVVTFDSTSFDTVDRVVGVRGTAELRTTSTDSSIRDPIGAIFAGGVFQLLNYSEQDYTSFDTGNAVLIQSPVNSPTNLVMTGTNGPLFDSVGLRIEPQSTYWVDDSAGGGDIAANRFNNRTANIMSQDSGSSQANLYWAQARNVFAGNTFVGPTASSTSYNFAGQDPVDNSAKFSVRGAGVKNLVSVNTFTHGSTSASGLDSDDVQQGDYLVVTSGSGATFKAEYRKMLTTTTIDRPWSQTYTNVTPKVIQSPFVVFTASSTNQSILGASLSNADVLSGTFISGTGGRFQGMIMEPAGMVGIGTMFPNALLDLDPDLYDSLGTSDTGSYEVETPTFRSQGDTMNLPNGIVIPQFRQNQFLMSTFTGTAGGSAERVEEAATVYIEGAPIQGTDITVATPYSLVVGGGASVFRGNTTVSGIIVASADPSATFNSSLSGDTDFWMGVQDDAGSDDDDSLVIGKGTTIGSNSRIVIDGAGNTTITGILTVDATAGQGQIVVDGAAGGCLMFRDTDDAGWTECDALDGTLTCSIDADGRCD